jgi:hypothetical protein
MADKKFSGKPAGPMDGKESVIWSTERVIELLDQLEKGIEPYQTPFWDGKPEWRSANIVFEYTAEEVAEIEKCARDVIYFANKYVFAMTDDGIMNILLRDYQEDILREFQDNRFCAFVSPRQIGKTITTGIFLTWYLLFHTDKNLMILSNTGATTIEIIDKIKVILTNLPFFLKPGVIVNNQMTMKFDNGCRLFGRNTTKTAAIGFAVHFLYCDEFAHIHSNFIDPFWRSVYPTLASSKISRCVITSTPNGQNKFYEIYVAGLEGKNEFKAIRVDWWQVPGRDEAWRLKEIANLGSEDDFNQEYGCQFLASSKLLLDSRTLSQTKSVTVEYQWREIEDIGDMGITDYDGLKWHPKFTFENVKPTDKFVFTIDTAGGGGGKSDFSVVNIFKMIPMPIAMLDKATSFTDESDFFSLLQIGLYRSNTTDLEILIPIIETLLYKTFGSDNTRIVLEMDFKGNLVYDRMSRHKEFYDDIFVHTKHSENSRHLKPGLKLNPKNKLQYCMEMRRLVKGGKIIPNEKNTFNELTSFGINKKGSYSSQIGHDDIAMTIVNMSSFFSSSQYFEMVEDIYDTLEDKYKKAIAEKLKAGDVGGNDDGFDMGFLKGLMQ